MHAELRVDAEHVSVLELAARSIGGLCSRALRFGAGVSLEHQKPAPARPDTAASPSQNQPSRRRGEAGPPPDLALYSYRRGFVLRGLGLDLGGLSALRKHAGLLARQSLSWNPGYRTRITLGERRCT